jgi:hypothetical protein
MAPTSCERCSGERRVYNAALKRRIRCPSCTTRRRRNTQAMREFVQRESSTVSVPEQQRMMQLVERSMREAVADTLNVPGVPAHLLTTHRILQRWAAEGTGAAAENEDVYHESRPPPLDPSTYAVVESLIAKAPPRLRSLTRGWYRTRASNKQLAQRRKMTVRSLGRLWTDSLVHLRQQFLASRHADLVALVNMQA